MTPTTYGKIEKGGHTQTRKLRDIADAFGVPLESVLMPRLPTDVDRTQWMKEMKAEIAADLRRELIATHPSVSEASRLLGQATEDLEQSRLAQFAKKSAPRRRRTLGRKK